MKKPRIVEIDTTGSVFFDLFEHAKAERLTIQSDSALELEREIKARKFTQAAAAKALGITQPRVNDLLRRRLDRFSIDALYRVSQSPRRPGPHRNLVAQTIVTSRRRSRRRAAT